MKSFEEIFTESVHIVHAEPEVKESFFNHHLFYQQNNRDRTSDQICAPLTLLSSVAIDIRTPIEIQVSPLPCGILFYVFSGCLQLSERNQQTLLPENTALYILSGKRSSFLSVSHPCCYAALYISGSSLPWFERNGAPYIRTAAQYPSLTRSRFTRLLGYSSALAEADCHEISRKLSELMYDLCAPSTDSALSDESVRSQSDYLTIMRQFMNENYSMPCSLEFFEQKLGISRYRLCREFSAAFHLTPGKYLQSVRIDRAAALLRDTSLSVREIAEQVGYDNISHFISLFRRETETTPGAYRTEARKHSSCL